MLPCMHARTWQMCQILLRPCHGLQTTSGVGEFIAWPEISCVTCCELRTLPSWDTRADHVGGRCCEGLTVGLAPLAWPLHPAHLFDKSSRNRSKLLLKHRDLRCCSGVLPERSASRRPM